MKEDYNKLTDEELVKKIVSEKDELALAELHQRYMRVVGFIGGWFLKMDKEGLIDIADEIFIRTYPKFVEFDENIARFSTWYYTIVRNRCNTIKIMESKIQASLDEYRIQIEQEIPNHLQEKEFSDREIKEIVDGCIRKLDEELREIIILIFYEQKKIKEVSNLLNIPESTVRFKRDKAKIILEKCLRSKGLKEGLL